MCAGGDDREMYVGFKGNRAGIWPLGLAWHTGRKAMDGSRVYGLQVGLLLFSFWLAVREDA